MLNNTGVNKVLLMGRIDKTPRWHSINQMMVLCITLVTKEYLKKNGNTIEHLEYHQVKAADSILENINLREGDTIYIQGKIQTHNFMENGIKRYKTEVYANDIQLIQAANEEVVRANQVI